jgi:hypothetical protein
MPPKTAKLHLDFETSNQHEVFSCQVLPLPFTQTRFGFHNAQFFLVKFCQKEELYYIMDTT